MTEDTLVVEEQNVHKIKQEVEPVALQNRINSLDLVRGVAVFGILLMNIQAYSMVYAAYANPLVWGDLTGINKIIWILGHVFASGKFITIFSMLFGAGIVLITRKAEEKGRSGFGVHFSRNFWLMLIGCIHGYLLWYGDILFTYGLCSLPVYFIRKLSPRKLLIIGLILLFIGSSMSLMFGLTIHKWPADAKKEAVENWYPPQEKIDEEIRVSRGNWGDFVIYRFPKTLSMQTAVLLFYTGWLVTGLMLIGMALFKWGIFSAEKSEKFYLNSFVISFISGMSLVVWGVIKNFEHKFSFDYSMFIGSQFNHWGAIAVAFSYVCLLMYVFKKGYCSKLMEIFQLIGRMALSNYLLQTIICVVIFYGGIGFGMFSRVERWGQFLIVLAVWLLLAWFSRVWMDKFRFGPFEWFWRTLTYRKIQKLKK